jgi:O-antigen ligase
MLVRNHVSGSNNTALFDVIAIVVAVVGAVILGALVTRDVRTSAIITVALLAAALLATTRGRLETELLIGILLVSATTDLPQMVHVGPVSGLGALTLVYALATVPFWLANPGAIRNIPVWQHAFLAWVLTLCILDWPLSVIGMQNVVVFSLFAGMIGISRHLTLVDGSGFSDRINHAFGLAGWLAVLLYGASVATGGLGSGRVAGTRSFALFALVVFGWALSRFRFERRCGILAAMLFVMILLSLSRGALGAATVMIVLAWFDMRSLISWIKAATLAVLALAAVLIAVYHVPELHHRFFSGDVQTVAPGVALNTSGRESIWRPVWNDALKSPWIGHGPGTGDNLTAHLSGFAAGETGAGNVHNDYLRMFHDYGLIGLFLWLATVIGLLGGLYRATGTSGAGRWPWGAYLALVGITLEMIVDNPVIEVDVMAPLGILIGIALAVSYSSVTNYQRSVPGDSG